MKPDWLTQFGINPALSAALREFHGRNRPEERRERFDEHDDKSDLEAHERLTSYPWGSS